VRLDKNEKKRKTQQTVHSNRCANVKCRL